MRTTKILSIIALTAAMVFTSCKEEEPTTTPTPDTTVVCVDVEDGDGNVVETICTITDYGKGTGNLTLTADKTWVLNGFVFVNSGQTLTVDPGTVVKGKSGQGENASALIVARGGMLMAEGTAAKPIIMTAESDQVRRDVDGNLENGGNLPTTARGLWGGLIVLGKAQLNSSPGESAIEGIPTSESRGIYGGSDDMDNSGKIHYVSIRHGGTDIGGGNEINGATFGGVGMGTSIHHLEIIANNDDGVEFFGGTASIKNLLSVNVGDDAIDYDEGWRGYIQYALVYTPGDRGGEHDGGTDPEDGIPYATPHIANVTSVGGGVSAGKRAITFRDNAGGQYWNSLFTMWGRGIDVEDLGAGKEHSLSRLDAGDLMIMYNAFDMVGNDTIEDLIVSSEDNSLTNHANVVGNMVMSLQMTGVVPGATVTADWTNFDDKNGWFDKPAYKGAFNPNGSDNWYEGWSLTDEAGVIQ